jgi:hypothetical protein
MLVFVSFGPKLNARRRPSFWHSRSKQRNRSRRSHRLPDVASQRTKLSFSTLASTKTNHQWVLVIATFVRFVQPQLHRLAPLLKWLELNHLRQPRQAELVMRMTMYKVKGLRLVLVVEATFSKSSGRVFVRMATKMLWLIALLHSTTAQLNAMLIVAVMVTPTKNLRKVANAARTLVQPKNIV